MQYTTPSTGTSRSANRKPTPSSPSTTSSAAVPKQTANVDNVRASLAKEGMYFENDQAFDSYPIFQQRIRDIVVTSRRSVMRGESLREIQRTRAENATKDEKTLFNLVVPLVIKATRGVPTSKRDFEGEIVHAAVQFESSGLDKRTDCQFIKHVLPKRIQSAGSKLGLTDPKPDYVFGLKRDRFPDPLAPRLSTYSEALIGVAPGLLHPWFVIENKGCEDSIEAAENQAIRSGATLVAARRSLAAKARTKDDSEEPNGADPESFAFSCSWVPQQANIAVHWHEKRTDGRSIYHMNILRGYLMSDSAMMSDFRRDIHNVLDWGLLGNRRQQNEDLIAKIAANEASF